jgi:hypothetical protein
VEQFAAAIARTPPGEALAAPLLAEGLSNLDSRGLAALLKELARGHHGKRGREVRAAACVPLRACRCVRACVRACVCV